MGRPTELSPKAWFYTRLYGGIRPFDRHDWTLDRCGREVRYVIDYYSAGKDGDGGTLPFDLLEETVAELVVVWLHIR